MTDTIDYIRHERAANIVRLIQRSALRVIAISGLGLTLVACQMSGSGTSSSPTELAEALSEYRVVPTARAFVNVPNALLVMERNLGIATEQRITLPNQTSLAGENTILLRAQTNRSASRSRLLLDDVLAQFGGTPTPFATIAESGLTALSDQYGDITYTVARPGGDVTCVLAFRRSQIGARALPRGTSALDLMLRNCVSGSVEDALSPIGPDAFGLGLARSG